MKNIAESLCQIFSVHRFFVSGTYVTTEISGLAYVWCCQAESDISIGKSYIS